MPLDSLQRYVLICGCCSCQIPHRLRQCECHILFWLCRPCCCSPASPAQLVISRAGDSPMHFVISRAGNIPTGRQKQCKQAASQEKPAGWPTWNLPDLSPAYSNHFAFGTGTVLCSSPMLGKPCRVNKHIINIQVYVFTQDMSFAITSGHVMHHAVLATEELPTNLEHNSALAFLRLHCTITHKTC